MKRTNAETVGDIINRLLKEENLDTKLNEQRLLNIWVEIVGPVVARYTSRRYIINKVLYVHITSAPLRNEISLHRSNMLRSLNEAIGSNTIVDIIIK